MRVSHGGLCVVQNAVPFAELLLANGAKTDMQSVAPHGFTPLFLAASHGFLQVLQYLLQPPYATAEMPFDCAPPTGCRLRALKPRRSAGREDAGGGKG